MIILKHPDSTNPNNISKYLDEWENTFEEMKSRHGFNWGFDGKSKHYLNLHTLALDQKEHYDLTLAQERLVELLHYIRSIIQENPQLLCCLGIPDSIKEACNNIILQELTVMGRFDWMIDENGVPKVLEFNSETPFGWVEAIRLQNYIAQKYWNDEKFLNVNTNLAEDLKEACRKSFLKQCEKENASIAIIGDIMDGEELAFFNLLKEIIDYPNANVSINPISMLDLDKESGELCIEGKIIDIIQTFYSVEWLAKDRDNGIEFSKSLNEGKIKLINPAQTLVMHSKALFALVWNLYSEGVLDEYKDVIENNIPHCVFSMEDKKENMKYMYKPMHYREGTGIEEASDDKDYGDGIFQEYIISKEVSFPVVWNGRQKEELLKPTIGMFLLGDKFAGYYTRLGHEIVNSDDVAWVSTLCYN